MDVKNELMDVVYDDFSTDISNGLTDPKAKVMGNRLDNYVKLMEIESSERIKAVEQNIEIEKLKNEAKRLEIEEKQAENEAKRNKTERYKIAGGILEKILGIGAGYGLAMFWDRTKNEGKCPNGSELMETIKGIFRRI